jgi:hypothetical protein
MASLSDTAYYTRRGVKFAAIGLVIYLILYIFWRLIRPLLFRPPPPAPPGQELGVLPPIKFPDQPNLPELEFKLETPQGAQPPSDLPQRARVYEMTVNQPQYLNLQEAVLIADKLDFPDSPKSITPSIYRWQRIKPMPGTLVMNIIHQSFDLVNDWRSDQYLLQEKVPLTEEKMLTKLTSTLKGTKLFSQDLENGYQQFIYYHFIDGQLLPAESLSQADLVQINFFRQGIEATPIGILETKDTKKTISELEAEREKEKEDKTAYPIVPLDNKYPLVWGLVTAAKDSKKFIAEIHFRHQLIEDKSGEYPLLEGQIAWQLLTEGNGYIVSPPKQSNLATVRDIYLGYYEPREPTSFLHPIFIFEGDDDFMAYLPALRYETIK